MRFIGGVLWSLVVAMLVGFAVGGITSVMSDQRDAAFLGFVGGSCLSLGAMLYQWGRKRFDL